LHVELVQHAKVGQRQRGIQAGLPAHRGQQRVGTLFLDDLGDDFGGNRLDIGGVGQTRIGHDRRGVRVHKDDAVALFAQGLAGLGAGVVKLAGLTDHDGTGSDDHDGFDIGSLRHGGPHQRKTSRVIASTRLGARGRSGESR
jgi:hypothetical protein